MVLNLSLEEAITLRSVIACCGGDSKLSARKFMNQIASKLKIEDYPAGLTGVADFGTLKKPGNEAKYIYFNNESITLVKKKAKEIKVCRHR